MQALIARRSRLQRWKWAPPGPAFSENLLPEGAAWAASGREVWRCGARRSLPAEGTAAALPCGLRPAELSRNGGVAGFAAVPGGPPPPASRQKRSVPVVVGLAPRCREQGCQSTAPMPVHAEQQQTLRSGDASHPALVQCDLISPWSACPDRLSGSRDQ
jgi:hypothetical protein